MLLGGAIRMDGIKLSLGEERFIKLKVGHRENQNFVIASAKYELINGQEVCSSGDMFIEGNVLTALIKAEKKGVYDFTVTLVVPPETLKHKVYIQVV